MYVRFRSHRPAQVLASLLGAAILLAAPAMSALPAGAAEEARQVTADVDDADGDSYRCDQDCNDADAMVNPGIPEKCDDGIDNDCNGLTDTNTAVFTLVEDGSATRYLANYADPGLGQTWYAAGFNDAAWSSSFFGIGYEDAPPGAEDLIQTNVASDASHYVLSVLVSQ